MKNIQKVSSYILVVLKIWLVVLPLQVTMGYFFVNGAFNNFIIDQGYSLTITHSDKEMDLLNVDWTLFNRLLDISSEVLAQLPFFLALLVLISIFQSYKKGDIFTINNAIRYRQLGLLYCLDALLIEPISHLIGYLAYTCNTSCVLSFQFKTQNISDLFFGICVIVISWIMIEASKINDEQKFTV